MPLYYPIWVDAIVSEQSKKGRDRNWKLFTIIPISILQGFNLLTFFYWMKILVNRNLPLFAPVNIFHAKAMNSFISILITLFIPFMILNYLLIFSNDRYKVLVNKYPNQNGKLYRKYVLYSLGVLIIPVIIKVMFFK